MKKLAAIILCLMALPSFGATCKISEYKDLVRDSNGITVPVPSEPAITTQTVTYTTSTQSTAFNAATKFVRIVCDAKAHFVFSASPTATASSPYLAADTAEYFGVNFESSLATLEVAFYDGSS